MLKGPAREVLTVINIPPPHLSEGRFITVHQNHHQLCHTIFLAHANLLGQCVIKLMAPLVGHLLIAELTTEESGGLQEGHPQDLSVPFVNAPIAPVVAVDNEDAGGILVLHFPLFRFLSWVTGWWPQFIFVVVGCQMEGQIVEVLIITKVYSHDGKKSETQQVSYNMMVECSPRQVYAL